MATRGDAEEVADPNDVAELAVRNELKEDLSL
jgi:hypothetical protein